MIGRTEHQPGPGLGYVTSPAAHRKILQNRILCLKKSLLFFLPLLSSHISLFVSSSLAMRLGTGKINKET